MTIHNWIMVAVTFFVAAVLEVGGDAVIRKAVEKYGLVLGIIGFLLLGAYGVIVNFLSGPEKAPAVIKCFVSSQLGGYKMDFSDLLGVYVAVFVLIGATARRALVDKLVPQAWQCVLPIEFAKPHLGHLYGVGIHASL